MKTRKLLSIILAAALIFSTFVVTASAENGNIIVLYSNDVHCAIDDYAVLAAYRAEKIAEGNTVITVDAGDAIQGEVIGTLTQGEAIVDIMNAAGYDYAVPGNHEYDYGMETFLDLAENKAEYEYISSNFYYLPGVRGVFEPYAIKDVNGVQIAFVGITTPESVSKANPQFFKDENNNFIYGFPTWNMRDGVLYENVQESVDNAIAEGADIVVAVGHLGILETTDGWKSTDVIANTNGIDYFIDAHSHETIESAEYKNKDNDEVILSSTGTKFANFGQLTIGADGSADFELIDPDEVDVETMSTDAKTAYNTVKEKIDGYNEEIAYLYEVIGKSDANLVAYDEDGSWAVRKRETNSGDFVADAYRAVTGADIALCNGGGIRNEIAVGDVTRKALMDMNPWSNSMCVIEITGQQLIDVLEHGARACPESPGGYFQVSGVTYEIKTWLESPVITDMNGNFISIDETMERRVANVLVNGEPVDLERNYTVAGTQYVLTSGGDGMTMLEGAKVVQQEGLVCDSEMLIKYLEMLGGKITAEMYGNPDGDGRISIVPEHIHKFPDDENCSCGLKKADYSGYRAAMNRYDELTAEYKDVLVEETKDYIRNAVKEIVNEYLGNTGIKNNYSEEEQYILDGIADGINEICDTIENGIEDGTLVIPNYTEIEEKIAEFEKTHTGDEYKALIEEMKAELDEIKKKDAKTHADIADDIEAIEEKIDNAVNCKHICHSDNQFLKIIWIIANFFHSIFGISPICDCGMAHY